MNRMLIQIVPELPPATSGVGDYALSLACLMRREFGLDTHFVVGNKGWQGSAEVEGFRVQKLAARSARSLAEALDAAPATAGSSSVLLQLSSYGYAPRGCPLWLLQGLKQWRAKQPKSRLVTMFHELYAFGPPWKSAFWLNPGQKMVIAGIAQLSDIAVTNIQLHRERLERFDSSKRGGISMLAVPSNVGEPVEPGDLDSRAKNMIVFGLPATRKRTYETQMAALQRACQQLGITEVHDIGVVFDGIPDRVGDVRVKKLGVIGGSELSSLLSRSTAGFLTYPHASLGKSGVFASYCAHRLIPVVPVTSSGKLGAADGIECGVHYLSAGTEQGVELQSRNAQAIADAAWDWYQGHSLESHGRMFAGVLMSSCGGDWHGNALKPGV